MSNISKFFGDVAEACAGNAGALASLSEIVESHARFSLDNRLSNDPLTALAAVMSHNDIAFKVCEGLTIVKCGYHPKCIAMFNDDNEFVTPNDIEGWN